MKPIVSFLILSLMTGCVIDNTNQMALSHATYNEVLVRTKQEELLLNLVRLRYRDTPFFLDTASVTTSFKTETRMGLGALVPLTGSGSILEPSGNVMVGVSPTVSFVPIEGDAFLQNFLTPIPLDELLVLTQSGWGIDRVFGITLERINNLYNAKSASGPTPRYAPEDALDMEQLLLWMRQSQLQGSLDWYSDSDDNIYMQLAHASEADHPAMKIRQLLEIDAESSKYPVSKKQVGNHGNGVAVATRSIMSILFYLSQNVTVPREHLDSGLVTLTRTRQGTPFDWAKTPAGKRFAVHSSRELPENAILQISYRGYFFFIKDNDLETKSTFMLLNHLYAFQSGTRPSRGPALTLPVGG